ncbi:MAG: sensor histidine kinase [Vicinamibacterales bacterium]
MTVGLSTDFGDVIAGRIRAARHEIAHRWLERLESLLPVETNEIFPSNQILDHIPALIHEIADYVGAAPPDALAANTVVLSKARELGELRFEQKASVHQLLREYRILAGVLGAFVHEQFDALATSSMSADTVGVINRLNDAVFVLMQTTVDTFVGRYTTRIEEQTTRLEGFNRMVSHELRQPLSSVQYAIELLRTPAAEEDIKRERLLEVADRNVKRLSQLLGMLGAIARPEHDSPQLQTVDASKIIAEVFRQLRDAAAAKGVSLTCDAPPSMVTVDVSRFELVLVNLVANAIKYRDPAKPEAFVEVSCVERPDSFLVHVRDNGLGIPSADHADVFRRFYRAHARRDGELGNDGIGLGLAIAADCAKGLKGSLTFESAEGVGTTFTLTLPREPNHTRER